MILHTARTIFYVYFMQVRADLTVLVFWFTVLVLVLVLSLTDTVLVLVLSVLLPSLQIMCKPISPNNIHYIAIIRSAHCVVWYIIMGDYVV
jgi:hypothetical protein